jgi:hypothetical protein
VGIIGAGVAGMFTAMIFDHLKETYGLNVTYEILEAEEERVGGRLYTYKFPSTDCYPAGPHDYYDVGAMRFPETPVMKRYVYPMILSQCRPYRVRTFELFTKLGMGPSQDPKNPKTGDLISYKMRGPNQPTLFNDVQVVQQPVKCEITQETKYKPDLSAAVFNVPDIPEGLVTLNVMLITLTY